VGRDHPRDPEVDRVAPLAASVTARRRRRLKGSAPSGPVVVLLHGLARTHRSLAALERFVSRRGYATWVARYPSRRMSIAELADGVAAELRAEIGDRPAIALTHSMGAIILRHLDEAADWRGAVMLAPPNQGSHVAARLRKSRLFRWFYGPAAGELAASAAWPPPRFPFAVIAGTSGPTIANAPSWLIGALKLLPAGEPNDGTVTVAETRLDGMTDFAEVPASHTWLMNHPRTRELIARYLDHGDFGERTVAALHGGGKTDDRDAAILRASEPDGHARP
jgi:triacylglycerol lipase